MWTPALGQGPLQGIQNKLTGRRCHHPLPPSPFTRDALIPDMMLGGTRCIPREFGQPPMENQGAAGGHMAVRSRLVSTDPVALINRAGAGRAVWV